MSTVKEKIKDDQSDIDLSVHKKEIFDARQLSSLILNGAIGVLETDTLYGLVGSAFYPDVVNKIYQIKHRNINKPFIILISDVSQMEYFSVELTKDLLVQLRQFWPGPCSIILPISDPKKFDYLTRGGNTLCFRMPNVSSMFELLDLTGPIVAPSANLEDAPPAKTIQEAYKYFGDKVDFYSDGGLVDREASRIIKFEDGKLVELRS